MYRHALGKRDICAKEMCAVRGGICAKAFRAEVLQQGMCGKGKGDEEAVIKRDCFAMKADKFECTALNGLPCKSGPCSFYKSSKQLAAEREKYAAAEKAWEDVHKTR